MEVGELSNEYDAPKETGHDAQCGEGDVCPERQSEATGHADVVRIFRYYPSFVLCQMSNVIVLIYLFRRGFEGVVKTFLSK